jgi:UDP-hydrolysing UDP-N-acetyl-D-glucosamine 2-epimerase
MGSFRVKRRKICVVTTSRADFGLLSGLMQSIRRDSLLRLQVIASGMHLSRRFGWTWKEIEAEGIKIDRKIDLKISGDSKIEAVLSISRGLKGFAEALAKLSPDILVMLGDRFELLAPATAALVLGIPIAHIHGGELSEGAIDDSVRHAITKMATIHFTATEVYRRRIIQMGESSEHVFNFGAPGLDKLYTQPLMTKAHLGQDLGVSLNEPCALITYHPVTRETLDVRFQIQRLVGAVKASGLNAIFTMANADPQGNQINKLIRAACEDNPARFKWIAHLGHLRYLSCLKYVAVMIGNSSSGLTEAPSFRLPVVNIGDRQRGRVKAANIIDVPCIEGAIIRGIRRAISPSFRKSLKGMRNPYDRFRDGCTNQRIKDVLRDISLTEEFSKKRFHDLM